MDFVRVPQVVAQCEERIVSLQEEVSECRQLQLKVAKDLFLTLQCMCDDYLKDMKKTEEPCHHFGNRIDIYWAILKIVRSWSSPACTTLEDKVKDYWEEFSKKVDRFNK
jgi:hypothetical protein